jgi:hypothetical protein
MCAWSGITLDKRSNWSWRDCGAGLRLGDGPQRKLGRVGYEFYPYENIILDILDILDDDG